MRIDYPWHVSPVTLAVGAALGGIALTLFPPAFYEELLGEPDRMFGNTKLIAYVLLCTLGFVAGTQLSRLRWEQSSPSRPRSAQPNLGLWPTKFAAGIVLLTALALLVLMPQQLIGIVVGAMKGQASEVREVIVENLRDTGFSPTSLLPLALPFVYLSAAAVLTSNLLANDRRLLRARRLHGVAVWIYLLLLVLTLQRNLLVPFLLGLFCLHSGLCWHRNGIAIKKLLGIISAGIVGFAILFVGFSYSRSGGEESPWVLLVGYIPASYNRLAYLLDGDLTSPLDFPYYSFRFFWHPPLIRRIVPVSDWAAAWGYQLPETSIEGWVEEFTNVSAAGLDARFIWPTAYGYVFYDFYWRSIAYFAVFGALCGWAWRGFRRNSVSGLVLYPYLASCIFLLSTDMIVSLPQTVAILLAAFSLTSFNIIRSRFVANRQLY